jgi:methyl-accepting chemotaxis protein
MVNAIFRPGVALMQALTTRQKMPLVTALFLLPLAILYYQSYPGISPLTNWLVGGTAALALFGMVAFYLQADAGWLTLIAIIKRLAEGDLTAQTNTRMGGHYGTMVRALQDVNRNLGQIVASVRASSQAVALSAGEIAAGNSNLSQRTEQQASTLEETASGMEELSGTVTQNADNCKLASNLAQNAERVAREGAQAVHGVVEGMGKIDQSSKRMADIIGVIEGIAFQTNILALNAAVEAARAGEQGRGFAVVAGEVRALAQRSAEAAKEIKSLIELSVGQISDGSLKAEGAGKVIDAIVTSVQQVNQLIGEIAVASSEQSTGVGEINKAILQLESVTQQNAALVEEASAASMTFQQQADHLKGIVARFRIAEDPAARPAASPAGRTAPAAKPLPKSASAAPRPAAKPLPKREPPPKRAPGGPQDDEDEWKEF